MGGMTLVLDDRVWTREERDQLPDDGHRYELIDGVLIVSPAPGHLHQRGVMELAYLLRSLCPPDLEVLPAPFDVALAADTVVEPDVLVARVADITDKDLPTAPLLAVEILSPSSQVIDRNLKLHRYERAGVPSYWIVDPGRGGRVPRVEVYRLLDGVYEVEAVAEGSETITVSAPFEVTICPNALVRR